MRRLLLVILTVLLLFSSCQKSGEDKGSSSGGPLVKVEDDYKSPQDAISDSKEEKERDGFPKIVINSFTKPESYMTPIPNGLTNEGTPTILKYNNKNYYISLTGYSSLAKFLDGKNILDFFFKMESLDNKITRLTNPQCQDENGFRSSSKLNESSQWGNGVEYWNRNYFGITDGVILDIKGEKRIIMTTHGENKNEKFASGQKYINTILPKRAYLDDEFSGLENGVYNDNPDTYFAFTGLLNIPAGEIDNISSKNIDNYDLGPVVWPKNPYVITEGSGINFGVRHPTLFAKDNFLYVFYVDSGYLSVARSDLQDKNNPFEFKKCLNGTFYNGALPVGFDKNKRDFLYQGGSDSDKVLRQSGTLFFSVAKIKGTDWYLGVEETSKLWPKTQIKLRASKDLINWSDGIILPDSDKAYSDIKLHYPKLVSKDGQSAKGIDLDEFYITGISGSNTGRNSPHIAKLSISLDK